MIGYRFEPGPTHLLRLEAGEDLYRSVAAYIVEHDVRAASVTFLGAVRRASLRYYNQDEKRYQDFEIAHHLEVVAGVGNVSILDGSPFLHIHAAFADSEGAAYGGHVNVGTEAFAIEVAITQLGGVAPVRQLDETTGLMLWGPPGT